MADTTPPTSGIPANDTPVQDLQINLADAPKVQEIEAENAQPELDLDLDLNLPEAPKNDDRLKNEDQKNKEADIEPIREQGVEEAIAPIPEPVVQQEITPEEREEETSIPEQEPIVQTIEQEETSTPSQTIIEENSSPAAATAELKEDMKIIENLEGSANVGGLAEEARVAAPQTPQIPISKTFDLDAMLGNATIQTTPPANIEISKVMPTATAVPMIAPAFSIPPNMAAQAIMQTTVPHKNSGVKALLFIVMFIALGFTTFFILKTMYPIELASMFGGDQTQTHASADLSGVIDSGIVDSGLVDSGLVDNGTIDTGIIISNNSGDDNFGELNDLGTPPIETPIQDDVSRLTEYVTQGNAFLAQGKTLGNNTIIKYGLYISKKSTDFLEKIANGEQIDNLSGYFAQFDQYITKLQELTGQTPSGDSSGADQTASSASSSNDLQGLNTNTETSPDTGNTSE